MQWLEELRLHLGNRCLGLRGRAQINLKRQGLPTQTRKTWHHWIWPLRRKCNCSQKRSMFIALNSFNIWFKCKLVYASSPRPDISGFIFSELLTAQQKASNKFSGAREVSGLQPQEPPDRGSRKKVGRQAHSPGLVLGSLLAGCPASWLVSLPLLKPL